MGRGGKTGQVQCNAAEEYVSVGRRRRLQPKALQSAEHERVERVACPSVAAGRFGNRNRLQGRERPVLLVGSSLCNPLPQQFDFRWIECLAAVDRRHPQILVLCRYARQQLTLIRLPRHDCASSTVQQAECRLTLIEPQSGFPCFRVRTMAGETAIGQQRTDLLGEIDRRIR